MPVATSTAYSSATTETSWRAIEEKQNLVAFLETLRRQVRLKLVSRHSCHPKFGGSILPYEKLKMGELSPEQEQLLQAVVQDMGTCKDYGRLELFQLPFKASVSYVETRALP